MIEENYKKNFEILNILKKSNEELKSLQEKLKTNSLVKIHVVEKTHFSLFKLKKTKVLNKAAPNKPMIGYVQSIILGLHEEYQKALDISHSLGEFGPEISKDISKLIQVCFSTHLHLNALEKGNLSHFEEQTGKEKGSLTLHEAERFFEEFLYDFRILKEEILNKQISQCENLPVQAII